MLIACEFAKGHICSTSNNYPASQNIGKISLKQEINTSKENPNSDYEVKNNSIERASDFSSQKVEDKHFFNNKQRVRLD